MHYYTLKHIYIKINFDTAIPRLQFILVVLVFQNTTKGFKSSWKQKNTISSFTFS